MTIVSSRRRVAELAAWAIVLLSLGAVAWSPISRPASTSPKIEAPKERHPLKWAATGFLAATLAFAPMNSNAAANELPAAGDTAVKVQVETNSLIRSIEDNGGQLNKAISDLVKDIPSKSIELDPPQEKAQEVRAVIKEDAGEVQKVSPSAEKVTIVEEQVIEEPNVVEQVDNTQTESATDATTEATIEKKPATEEAQVAEKALKTQEVAPVLKADDVKKEEARQELMKESLKEEPKVEETKEAPEVEMIREAPKKEPKVEKAKEAPKEEAKLEKTKLVPEVEMMKAVPKETEEEARKSEPVMIEAAKSFLVQFTDQLQESGANQFMEDLTENLQGGIGSIARFWNTPSGVDIKIPPTGSHPEGQTFELTRLNVAGASLLGLGASYYVSYEYYNYENEQEEIKAKKKKADIKAKLAAKKKGEKAAKPKKERVRGAVKPGAPSLDSRCETTSQELLATAKAAAAADAAAAAAEAETLTARTPEVSPDGATAPSVSPNGATAAPPVSPKGVTAVAAYPARDSTMDAFAQALAAMSNSAGQNGQMNPSVPAEEAKKPGKDSPSVARSGSSYLDSLSRR